MASKAVEQALDRALDHKHKLIAALLHIVELTSGSFSENCGTCSSVEKVALDAIKEVS